MKTFKDLNFNDHGAFPEATEATMNLKNGFISIVGGAEMLKGDGIDSFEVMIDIKGEESLIKTYQSIDDINELMENLQQTNKTNDMELLSVEGIDLDENFIEVLFDGLFKEGFYVTTEFEYDVEVLDVGDEDTLLKEVVEAANISFWDFKTWDAENEEIKINNRELKRIKELVEFKLIDLLSDELNNY